MTYQPLKPFHDPTEETHLHTLDPFENHKAPLSARKPCTTILLSTTLTLLLLSLTLNILLFLRLPTSPRSYTGISHRSPTYLPIQTTTDFSSENRTVADAAWETYTVNGFVALSRTWAQEQHLPPSRAMPDDPEKGLYVVDGFHQLHCVMYLRTALLSLLSGRSLTNTMDHVNHCYEMLRQAIICRADDTPLVFPGKTTDAGKGQVKACRSWDALTEWAVHRSACYPTLRC